MSTMNANLKTAEVSVGGASELESGTPPPAAELADIPSVAGRPSGGHTTPISPAAARFDRKFIDEHGLLDKYLSSALPVKGARDLEQWCRTHPEFLEEHKIAERAQASLRLLDASGRPADLAEPTEPWWRNTYVHIGVALIALASLLAFFLLLGKYERVKSGLEDAKLAAKQGALLAPSSITAVRIDPDRSPGLGGASISATHAAATLIALKINMSFTKLAVFKVTVEKTNQGRALVLDGLAKDSNGDLKVEFNSSGLPPGTYDIRIDGLPFRGQPIGMGWLTLNVH